MLSLVVGSRADAPRMRIFSSPSITELPLPNVDLYPPKGPTDAITATLEYLRRLHYLISLAKPLAQELHDLELESMDTFSDPDKFRHFGEKWKALDRQITAKQTEWKVKHGKSRAFTADVC